jgi:hypothetical protein
MLDWIQDNDVLLGWLAAASVAMFIGTLIVIPFLVVRIPEDYFARRSRRVTMKQIRHPMLKGLMFGLKNLLGAIFLLAGVAMLALPGQGVLTIVIGLALLDFPGKFAFERWLVRRRAVLGTINWMRRRRGRPLLRLDDAPDRPDGEDRPVREDQPNSASS